MQLHEKNEKAESQSMNHFSTCWLSAALFVFYLSSHGCSPSQPTLDCQAGQQRSCYDGDSKTLDVGSCRSGQQTCTPQGKWSACIGQTLPRQEICDQIDNNCDGHVDNGLLCDCEPATFRSCYTAGAGCRQNANKEWVCAGTCKAGQQVCGSNRKWGSCFQQIVPVIEKCNNQDDDCDGTVDETCKCSKPSTKEACYTRNPHELSVPQSGCRQGERVCQDSGQWGPCIGEVTPQPEVCNGQDDDCDGAIDEGYKERGTLCEVPGKSGSCAKGQYTCQAGKLLCEASLFPQNREFCGNGLDDNCNGKVDESPPCACQPGQTQPCFTGGVGCIKDNATQRWQCKGNCQTGIQTCQPDSSWSACVGATLSKPERCDGQDNNCDGNVDEIWSQKGQTCVVGLGECQATGQWRCKTDTSGLYCDGLPATPQPEKCDGKDNDCDGLVDEDLRNVCYSGDTQTLGYGACRSGAQLCQKGKWTGCLGEVLPQPETCDGKDNDCDGKTDERLPDCIKGCQGNSSAAEICDGLDNDCDGLIDENILETCYTGPKGTAGWGPCKRGTRRCSDGSWERCKEEVTPKPERCDGVDNDCDGLIDEGLYRTCYTGSEGTLKGICHGGLQTCAAGEWSRCTGQITPQTESCDGKDNDCDGLIDEDNPGGGSRCDTAKEGSCSIGKRICQKGKFICQQTRFPTQEICDNEDNDCDGKIDNGITRPCQNACGLGVQFCYRGQWYRNCINSQKPEICDRKDNDCDGLIDEGCTCQECHVDQDCAATGPNSRCVQGRCYQACESGRCAKPFVCQINVGPYFSLCVPPNYLGAWLWTCSHYLALGKYCTDSNQCGGDDPVKKIGAICDKSICRVRCNHTTDCPPGTNIACVDNICQPD